MATLSDETSELATAVRLAMIALRTLVNGNAADLTALTTTDKTSLVAAVNELVTAIDGISGGGASIAVTAAGTASTEIDSITYYWPVFETDPNA